MSQKVTIPKKEFLAYRKTHSIQECAVHFGCSVAPIHRMNKECGFGQNFRPEKINPRKKILDKDEIYELYIVRNLPVTKVLEKLGCSGPTFFKACKDYGIARTKKDYESEVVRMTRENYTRSEIVEELGCSFATVNRILARTGVHRTNEQMKARWVNPMDRPGARERQREGVRRVYSEKAEEMRRKREQTMLKRYGVMNPMQIEGIQERIQESNLKRFGYKYHTQRPEYREEISKKLKDKWLEKRDVQKRVKKIKQAYEEKGKPLTAKEYGEILGLADSNARKFMRDFGLDKLFKHKNERLEKDVEKFLRELGVVYRKHDRKILAPQELDFYFPERHVAIEVNDIASHNSTYGYKGGEPKEKNYHIEKTQRCQEKGIRLIHLWEQDWENSQELCKSIIRSALRCPIKRVYARNCEIRISPSRELKEFFEQNHLQGFRGGSVAVSLAKDGKVLESYIFGKPYFNKNYEWEVIRAATLSGVQVVGGISKIWSAFLKEYQPKSVVFYVDYNYFTGAGVEQLGLRFVKWRNGYWDYIRDSREVVGRNPSRNQERKLLKEQGKVWEIWHAGTGVYEYISS